MNSNSINKQKKDSILKKTGNILLSFMLCIALTATAVPAFANGPDEGSAPGGGSSSSSISWSGATEITSATETNGETYSSTTASENAVLIDTSDDVTLTNATVTKSGGTSAGDDESFTASIQL